MSEHVVTVNAENWEEEVVKAEIPVIVDLWAPWCGPCRALSPLLEELAGKYEGKVKVTKVNVDEQPEISNAFDVQAIPTVAVVFKGGLVGKVQGFGGRQQVEGIFEEVSQLPEKLAEAIAAEKDAEGEPPAQD